MSPQDQNKAFLTGALNNENIDFSNSTYGLWISRFDSLAIYPEYQGYTPPEPVFEDIVALDFAIAGKKFSFLNMDGKSPDVKFIVTSGIKGADGYEVLVPAADITSTFISVANPSVILPDMDFAGKLYRKYETTALKTYPSEGSSVLTISSEDWQDTSISVNSNGTNNEYTYPDSSYIGYSNQVNARYKFLYDDSNNSSPSDISTFDVPTQITDGSTIRYRISRRSDPLGTYETATVQPDGKVSIDYSQYKDEVSGPIDSSVNYAFSDVSTLTFSSAELTSDDPITKSINDSSLGNLRVSKSTIDGVENVDFNLVTAGYFDSIYKVSFTIDRFWKKTLPIVQGFVLNKVHNAKTDSEITINVGDSVYPRTAEGSKLTADDLGSLFDVQSIVENEANAQKGTAPSDKSASTIADILKNENDALIRELEDDGVPKEFAEIINKNKKITTQEKLRLSASNNAVEPIKLLLPNFPLPKETVDQDYFSNYLNSGESYVSVPSLSYGTSPVFFHYGEDSAQLGYFFETKDADGTIKTSRRVVNSTSKGMLVDKTSFCKGDSSIYANTTFATSFSPKNGTITEIPANGIISYSNYSNNLSWQNAINYYYSKNYVSSRLFYPSYSKQEYINSISAMLKEASNNAGFSGSSGSSGSSGYSGSSPARFFVEREIYTEIYKGDELGEFNRALKSSVLTPSDADLNATNPDKLYCVQTFDSNFSANNPSYFSSAPVYQERLTFDKFLERGDISYSISDGLGILRFSSPDSTEASCYRPEYVTANSFSYTDMNSGAFVAWSGSSGATITGLDLDTVNYAYHLYGYDSVGDTLTFVRSNVQNNSIASSAKVYVVVIKFSKLAATNTHYISTDSLGQSYLNIDSTVVDSGGLVIIQSKLFFNVQRYKYEIIAEKVPTRHWNTYHQNPINDNSYGSSKDSSSNPRFFEDAPEASKSNASLLFSFPNGPAIAKNYEGTTVNYGSANALADGLFSNTISIIEQNSSGATVLSSNYLLDFPDNSGLSKQKRPLSFGNLNIPDQKRLKVTKVIYKVYTKDLIVVGDASSPHSLYFNDGWEYKLQYRRAGSSDTWLEMQNTDSLSNSLVSAQYSVVNPFYYDIFNFDIPDYLPMVAFKTNLPRFQNDVSYEFRVFKYEKLNMLVQGADVIRKTNFLPTQVDWTPDSTCSYYNIYQKDRAGNLKLVQVETDQSNYTYALPSVKQKYVDLGAYDFGSPNGVGYYDMVVSGVVQSVSKSTSSPIANSFDGNQIGDSNSISTRSTASNAAATTFKAISGPTYSPVINFNNPEAKASNFDIDRNYNGYYFVSDSKDARLDTTYPFECYVANIGASTCDVWGTPLLSNRFAKVSNSSSTTIATDALQLLPTATLSATTLSEGQAVYLKNDTIISDSVLGTVILINDSSSDIVVTYGGSGKTLKANKSYKLSPTDAEIDDSDAVSIANKDIQTTTIESQNGLVNVNYSALTVPNSIASIPVFNSSDSALTVNGSLSLAGGSFSLVSTNGAGTASKVSKSTTDSIRYYLSGKESDLDSVLILQDDSVVVLDNFTGTKKTYYFIKNENIKRLLNISIQNGQAIERIPIENQDFQLTVSKTGSVISKTITYPVGGSSSSINPDPQEQVVLLKEGGGSSIDLGYIVPNLKKGAFVYFVNKGGSVDFLNNGKKFTLAGNQVARLSLSTNSDVQTGEMQIVENAQNHFEFDFSSSFLASAVNLIDLKFCGCKINAPDNNSFTSKNAYLTIRNRFLANRFNLQSVSDDSGLLDEWGEIQKSSLVVKIEKSTDTVTPRISRLSYLDAILPEKTLGENPTYFYVNDSSCDFVTLKDYYNRKDHYSGKIIFPKVDDYGSASLDGVTNRYVKDCNSLDFSFDSPGILNGNLNFTGSKIRVLNTNSEGTSPALPALELAIGEVCVNFAYDYVTVATGPSTTISLPKNKVVQRVGLTYPTWDIFGGNSLVESAKSPIGDLNDPGSLSDFQSEKTYSIIDYGIGPASQSTNPKAYCFGRISKAQTNDGSPLVNCFYLNALLGVTKFEVPLNNIWIENSNYDLEIIEPTEINLNLLFANGSSKIKSDAIPSEIVVPFTSQLVTYTLPALTADPYGDGSTLGSRLNGKKIIFINLAYTNSTCQNKVKNPSDGGSLTTIGVNGSTLEFSCNGSAWAAITAPSLQAAYPTLKNVQGVVPATSTTQVAIGGEFVYLPNFDAFNLSVDSFQDKSFRDFYIYNSSALPKVNVISTKRSSFGGLFSKASLSNSNQYDFQTILLGKDAAFLVLKADYGEIVDKIYLSEKDIKNGSAVKIINTSTGLEDWYFGYFQDGLVTPLSVSKDAGRVDVAASLADGYALFQYGSAARSENSQPFDTYDIQLINYSSISSTFCVYNNTTKICKLYFSSPDNPLLLPAGMMMEISKSSNSISAKYSETHQKGKFFISQNLSSKYNYIKRDSSDIVFNSLPNYSDVENVDSQIPLKNDYQIYLSIVSSSGKSIQSKIYDTTGGSSYLLYYLDNRKILSFGQMSDFNVKRAGESVVKPNLEISGAGHYILNDSNYDLMVSTPANEKFLVNNCAKDILCFINDKATILYRNTVLVTLNDSISYLKKAKNRDEFFCVLNPKTLISTQSEISLNNGIYRALDILPIEDRDGYDQQSYVKLISKDGSESTTYLNLKDYYNGIDIPTDSPTDVVAYEVGLGHETIYKFLFYDPSSNTYTLPGIEKGATYKVEINQSLFDSLNIEVAKDSQSAKPFLRYGGKDYFDQETFTGSNSSWYEVQYPNYVRLYKLIVDINGKAEQSSDSIADGDLSGLTEEVPVPSDVDLIKEKILSQVDKISWIPSNNKDFSAFWLGSNFQKDNWIVDSVGGEVKTISLGGYSVSFVECSLKKNDFRSPISSLSFSYYSALQPKTILAEDGSVTMGLDYNMEPNPKRFLQKQFAADYGKVDYIVPTPDASNILLARLPSDYLKLTDSSQLESSHFEIKVSIQKLNAMPTIQMDDFSKSSIINQLNVDPQ